LWEDFQPEPDLISRHSLELLVQAADCAAEAGVLIQPTLFVGHMSGGNYVPGWALSARGQRRLPTVCRGQVVPEGVGDLFSDPGLLAAQRLLARRVAEALAGHPALGSWDLANELDGVFVPDTSEETVRWAAMLYETLKEVTPDIPVTIGLHQGNICRDLRYRHEDLAPYSDYACMHAYSLYAKQFARFDLDPEVAPFLCALSAGFAGEPVLMHEFGLCTVPPGEPGRVLESSFEGMATATYAATEEEAAEFYEQVLERLWRTGTLGAWAWCFADYVEDLYERPPFSFKHHERSFGIVRADGSLKPAAEVLRRFARERKEVVKDYRSLDVASADFYAGLPAILPRLYSDYLERRTV